MQAVDIHISLFSFPTVTTVEWQHHHSCGMRVGQGGNVGWLRSREMGLQSPLGHSDQFKTMLYSSVDVQGFWDPVNRSTEGSYGGIFNFDFSTDG